MNRLPDPEIEFFRLGGRLAESFSFSRSVGQIFALLYISPHPVSLEEIAKKLSISKGNVSVNVRILESRRSDI
jgi:DNA-binding transcriptional regulator GbsR (MarR family)